MTATVGQTMEDWSDECWNCGGDGFIESDDWQDDPDDDEMCHVCQGSGVRHTMTPQPGSTITFRHRGKAVTMVVQLVYEVDGERWLFSGVDALGNWRAVNSKWVLGVK